jgi:hypothetical protein
MMSFLRDYWISIFLVEDLDFDWMEMAYTPWGRSFSFKFPDEP